MHLQPFPHPYKYGLCYRLTTRFFRAPSILTGSKSRPFALYYIEMAQSTNKRKGKENTTDTSRTAKKPKYVYFPSPTVQNIE
jgi:hypothetical protein